MLKFNKNGLSLAESAKHTGMQLIKHSGFTLAEVLITLGIIGVVAALTIPSLMQNYKKHQATTKLKRFYSTMQQAIRLSEEDNGEAGSWTKESLGDLKDDDGNVDYDANKKEVEQYVNQYLRPYIKIADFQLLTNSNDTETYKGEAYMVFLDGSWVYLHNGNCVDFYYDLNGPNGPNKYGSDIFNFLLCPAQLCEKHKGYPLKCGEFAPAGKPSANRQAALNKCKNKAKECSELLRMDGFNFNNDYPYKL